MTNFNFKLNCSFCQSRIGSEHCLLPFQVTEMYIPPEDTSSAIMDITELHMNYGTASLQYNFGFINSLKARKVDTVSDCYTEQVPPSTSQWSDVMNDLARSNSNTENQPDDEIISTSGTDFSTWITNQLDESQLVENDSSSSTNPTIESLDLGVKLGTAINSPVELNTNKEELTSIADTSSLMSEHTTSLKKKSSTPVRKFPLEREEINHIVQDLLLAVKSSYILYSAKRSGIKTTALIGSICSESQLRDNIGMNYNPSYKTTLDGNKALAKEIIARHSCDKIEAWEQSEPASCNKLCILDYHKFSIMLEDESTDKLADSLIKYFNHITTNSSINETQRAELIENLEFELSKCDMSNVLIWINGKIRSLKKANVSIPKKEKKPIVDSPVTKESYRIKPYPPTDQRLIDFINTHLQVVVNQEIVKSGTSVPQLTDQTSLGKFFFKLATEFLRRNKGWLNENSFTTANHLTKLEESTGLKVKPSEAFLTFKTLKCIIDNFRIRFKARHSKLQTE